MIKMSSKRQYRGGNISQPISFENNVSYLIVSASGIISLVWQLSAAGYQQYLVMYAIAFIVCIVANAISVSAYLYRRINSLIIVSGHQRISVGGNKLAAASAAVGSRISFLAGSASQCQRLASSRYLFQSADGVSISGIGWRRSSASVGISK